MLVNLNGSVISESIATVSFHNRGLYYGDSVFETIYYNSKTINFFEDHYFRLMASMRILRMNIPSLFTPEYLESEILDLINQNNLIGIDARIRLTVWRDSAGFYTPESNEVAFVIQVSAVNLKFGNTTLSEVELYKDHYIQKALLSNLKMANKQVNILAGIFAKENEYNDLFLLNDDKMVVETIAGNVFLRVENTIKTPPLTDGCLNGITRKKLIELLKKLMDYTIVEESISPFDLQRADEIFTTNSIKGFQSILKYRKKTYSTTSATELNELFREKYFNLS